MTQVNTAGVVNIGTPQRRTVAVAAAGGVPVLISASIFCGYAEIQECPLGSEVSATKYDGTAATFAAQGLNVTRADENYVNTYGLPPGSIWQIGDAIRKSRCEGVPARTDADGSVRPATPWIKVVSATATTTQVEVREWRQQ